MLTVDRDNIIDFFFCIFLALAGLGNYYNELFQVGGVVVPADIGLVLFVGVLIILKPGIYFDRKHSYLIVCFFMMFIIGFIGGHSYSDIFRDIKVFLYFFVAYLYCYERKENYRFISRISKTIVIMILFTIVTCTIDFFQYGLSVIDKNQILRTFGLGLSQTGLAAAFIIFWAGRDLIKRKLGSVLYYVILIAFLVLTVVSYTRSNWILLALSVVAYIIIAMIRNSHNRIVDPNSVINGVFYFFLLCVVAYIAYRYVADHYPKIVNLTVSRMNSIAYFGTGESYNGNVDTFSDRMIGLLKYSGKYLHPLILLGWGFGDRVAGDVSTITENSFLYYTWKYGVIWCIVLFSKLYGKFRDILSRNNKINNAVFVSLISYFILGGLSGHLNKYYMLPYIAILLLVDFDKFLRVNSEEDYYSEIEEVDPTDIEYGG